MAQRSLHSFFSRDSTENKTKAAIDASNESPDEKKNLKRENYAKLIDSHNPQGTAKKIKLESSIENRDLQQDNVESTESFSFVEDYDEQEEEYSSIPGNEDFSNHQFSSNSNNNNLLSNSNTTQSHSPSEHVNISNSATSPAKFVITHIPLKGGDLLMITNFLSAKKSKELLDWFMTLDWQASKQPEFLSYDKVVNSRPRLIKHFGVGVSGGDKYYLGTKEVPWPDPLVQLRKQVETITNQTFNFVLVNYYRDGQDYISPHSDKEIVLGENPVIASLSIGATRDFVLRHKTLKDEKKILPLFSGSLLVMQGETQKNWTHAIPKMKKEASGPRFNLTFRRILDQYVTPSSRK